MGLDMDVYGDRIVWYMDDKPHPEDDEVLGKVKEVRIRHRVMTWRKANQIHKWFVDNVQNGDDDCREYYVDFEQLKELKDVVEQVLADHSKAPVLLPTQEGFFFGDTEYGKYYFEDLEYTKERLDVILDEKNKEKFEGIDLTYTSSW